MCFEIVLNFVYICIVHSIGLCNIQCTFCVSKVHTYVQYMLVLFTMYAHIYSVHYRCCMCTYVQCTFRVSNVRMYVCTVYLSVVYYVCTIVQCMYIVCVLHTYVHMYIMCTACFLLHYYVSISNGTFLL